MSDLVGNRYSHQAANLVNCCDLIGSSEVRICTVTYNLVASFKNSSSVFLNVSINVFFNSFVTLSTSPVSKSRVMRKPTFCICKNKGADQIRSYCEADQHLCFRYMDSTIPLLKSEIRGFNYFL